MLSRHSVRSFSRSTTLLNKDVVILGAARTPIGSFQSQLGTVTAPELGSAAIKAALERSGVKPDAVQEVGELSAFSFTNFTKTIDLDIVYKHCL